MYTESYLEPGTSWQNGLFTDKSVMTLSDIQDKYENEINYTNLYQ